MSEPRTLYVCHDTYGCYGLDCGCCGYRTAGADPAAPVKTPSAGPAAARKVIEVVADRQAVPGSNIPSGAEYVCQLVSALAEYHAVAGNR